MAITKEQIDSILIEIEQGFKQYIYSNYNDIINISTDEEDSQSKQKLTEYITKQTKLSQPLVTVLSQETQFIFQNQASKLSNLSSFLNYFKFSVEMHYHDFIVKTGIIGNGIDINTYPEQAIYRLIEFKQENLDKFNQYKQTYQLINDFINKIRAIVHTQGSITVYNAVFKDSNLHNKLKELIDGEID